MGLPQGQDHGLSIADQARASQQNGPPNVRYGSKADKRAHAAGSRMSALPPKADITAGLSESPLCAMSGLMQCSDLVTLARKLSDSLGRVLINPLSVSATKSMSASLRKRLEVLPSREERIGPLTASPRWLLLHRDKGINGASRCCFSMGLYPDNAAH
jgi:hypothetical protein